MVKKILYISLTLALSVVFFLCGYIVFRDSYLRLWEALCDLATSVRYYVCWIFDIENTIPRRLPNIPKLWYGTCLCPLSWKPSR